MHFTNINTQFRDAQAAAHKFSCQTSESASLVLPCSSWWPADVAAEHSGGVLLVQGSLPSASLFPCGTSNCPSHHCKICQVAKYTLPQPRTGTHLIPHTSTSLQVKAAGKSWCPLGRTTTSVTTAWASFPRVYVCIPAACPEVYLLWTGQQFGHISDLPGLKAWEPSLTLTAITHWLYHILQSHCKRWLCTVCFLLVLSPVIVCPSPHPARNSCIAKHSSRKVSSVADEVLVIAF